MATKQASFLLLLKDKVSKGLATLGGRMQKFRARLKSAQFGIAAVAGVAGFLGKKMIDAADKMEQWTISFTTMLGSAGKARDLMNEIKTFAAETPFELPDVIKGAKGLLEFGIEAEKVIPTLKNLGDVSAGLDVPIERLILNFGQVRAQTKLTGRELRDFAIAGVPLLSELAKNLNVTEAQIQEMVSRGEIGFEQVEAAFASMAGEGGRFNDLMSRQMETFGGIVSNVQDQLFQLSAELGENLLPIAKEVGLAIIAKFKELMGWVKDNSVEIQILVNAIVFWGETTAQVIEFITSGFMNLVETFMNFGEALQLLFSGDFPAAIDQFKLTFQEGFDGFKNSFNDLVTDVVKAQDKMTKRNIQAVQNETKKRREELKNQKTDLTVALNEEESLVKQNEENKLAMEKQFAKELEKQKEKERAMIQKHEEEKRRIVTDSLNRIASLSTAHNSTLAAIGKTTAIAIATIDTYKAANKALASAPPPFNFALAAGVIAAGLANVATIRGTPLQEGGVVLPRSGGTLATIGEGGSAEAVIPLDSEEAQERLAGILQPQVNITIEAGSIIADEISIRQFAERIDEELFNLRANRETVSI